MNFAMTPTIAPKMRLSGLEAFVAGCKGYEVDGDRVRRVHSVNVRGFQTLPTTVEAR